MSSYFLSIYEDYLYGIIEIKKMANVVCALQFDNLDDFYNEARELEKLYDILQNEKTNKRFKKAAKRFKKYVYENNNYAIIYPKTPKDLAEEGSSLNHCVGDYVDKIIKGKTDILFLRKKENIKESFFTIEVSRKGRIRQVHGYDNCNIDRDSSEYKFLKKWAKKNNLRFGQIDKMYNAE